eukprot:Skav218395  [mRNA]  locus=scaffold790:223414:232971:+ [translate_table: standard]
MVLFDLANVRPGDSVSLVAITLCRGDKWSLVQTCDRRQQRMMIEGLPSDVFQMTLLDVRVEAVTPLPCLKVVESTRVEKLGPCTKAHLLQVTELCSGMGAFSSEWEAEGFNVRLGVDQNSVWHDLFVSAHSGSKSEFVAAAAGSTQTVKAMYDRGLVHGTVLAGVSCQPFSRLGDGAGMDDTRSSSLYEVLSTGWLTQSAVIVLECVAQFYADLRWYASATRVSNGPIGVLVARVAVLGWSLCATGLFQDTIGCFDLLSVSWQELWVRIKIAWIQVMASDVLHRASFAELHHADLGEISRPFASLSEGDASLLRCHMDGMLYPEHARAKFQESHDGACPWCGQPDGFYHRAWQCEHFHEDRKDVPRDVLEMVPSLPLSWSCHCWLAQAPALHDLHRLLCHLPKGSLQLAPPEAEGGSVQNVFVDGSCLHGAEPTLRLAAWAVTWADPGFTQCRSELLGAGHVPGLCQTAYRGELYAVKMAIEWVVGTTTVLVIWCDNAAVVRGVNRILHRQRIPKPNQPHSDLWREIFGVVQSLQPAQLQIRKVMSHGDPARAVSMVEAWAFHHNSLVDSAAVGANHRRPSAFMHTWQQVHDVTLRNRHIHKHVCEVHVKTAKRAVSSAAPKASGASVSAVPPEVLQADAAPLPVTEWSWSPAMSKKLGESSLRKVSEWWVTLGVPVHDGLTQHRWVSWFHLFASFVRHAKVVGPVCVNRRWLDGDDVEGYHTLTSMQRVRTFQRFLRVFWDHHGFTPPGKYTRCYSTSVDVRLNCVYLCWPLDDLSLTDQQVAAAIGVVKKPGQLDGFVFGEG